MTGAVAWPRPAASATRSQVGIVHEDGHVNAELFINYRGADSHSYAALLYVELSRCFGPERVFLDSESIPAGADFVAQLRHRIHNALAVLAVIGPGWLAGSVPLWRPRNRLAADWAGRELTEAFAAGVTVIPILTDHTELPTERQLPTSLAPLSRCQYRRLRHRDATVDLDRIIHDLIAADPALAHAATRRQAAAPLAAAGTVEPACSRPDPNRPGCRGPGSVQTIRSRWAAVPADPDSRAALYRSLVAAGSAAGRSPANWHSGPATAPTERHSAAKP